IFIDTPNFFLTTIGITAFLIEATAPLFLLTNKKMAKFAIICLVSLHGLIFIVATIPVWNSLMLSFWLWIYFRIDDFSTTIRQRVLIAFALLLSIPFSDIFGRYHAYKNNQLTNVLEKIGLYPYHGMKMFSRALAP